jgi:hypothetical protein
MAAKLTRLTHKIAIQLHLVTESCTICSSRSRRPVRKLLVSPSYIHISSGFPGTPMSALECESTIIGFCCLLVVCISQCIHGYTSLLCCLVHSLSTKYYHYMYSNRLRCAHGYSYSASEKSCFPDDLDQQHCSSGTFFVLFCLLLARNA